MKSDRKKQLEAFERVLDVMETLREKCPWDRKQTFDSLRCNTIEETYELVDAIQQLDMPNIKKELGDVLLHIVFYALMAQEKDEFDIADVCNSLCDKLIFRHPHVYGEVNADTPDAVIQNWEQIKLKEKEGNKSVLSGVPAALPALIKAHRIQDKARNVGFDWEEREQVWDKVQEEIGEFKEEVKNCDEDKMEAEFGDLMFSIIMDEHLPSLLNFCHNCFNSIFYTRHSSYYRYHHLSVCCGKVRCGRDTAPLTHSIYVCLCVILVGWSISRYHPFDSIDAMLTRLGM